MNRRPAIVTDEHIEYLDELRDRGAINMFGAGRYLVQRFSVTTYEAHEILTYWMAMRNFIASKTLPSARFSWK